jgi:hypothetical protein
MKTSGYFYVFLALNLILSSCDIKKSDVPPETSFVKVYESTNIDEAYYPEDIHEFGDDYLLLSALKDSSLTNFPKISIILISSSGEVLSSIVLPENLVNPVHGWLSISGSIYLVCMDDITLQAKLLKVTVSNENIQYEEELEFDRKMPLSVWNDESGVILLSYDRIGRYSIIDKYDSNLNPEWSSSSPTNEDFNDEIWDHFKKTGKPFPFFIGSIDNGSLHSDYFVNCLDNYSMALLFLTGASGEITGKIFSYQAETAISSALHLQNDTFSLSRYHSGDNFIYPKTGLDVNELLNTNDFQDILISQLQTDARMDVVYYQTVDEEFIVYASTTKSNQIVLMFFDPLTGLLKYTHTLGYGNPVEVVTLLQTDDDGFLVLGKTWINGQYQRIILYKVSEDQLETE